MKRVIILFFSLVILVGCGEGVIYGKWEAYIDGYYSYDDIELRVDDQMQISINPIGVEFLCDILGNGINISIQNIKLIIKITMSNECSMTQAKQNRGILAMPLIMNRSR